VQLTIDRTWLLEIIQQRLHDAPDVTDWGSTAAAVARHSDTIMDHPVYAEPHHTTSLMLEQVQASGEAPPRWGPGGGRVQQAVPVGEGLPVAGVRLAARSRTEPWTR
jgi:hypothetical protein